MIDYNVGQLYAGKFHAISLWDPSNNWTPMLTRACECHVSIRSCNVTPAISFVHNFWQMWSNIYILAKNGGDDNLQEGMSCIQKNLRGGSYMIMLDGGPCTDNPKR